jgi:hypothetical protein
MAGGNSHQRAVERGAKARMAGQVTEVVLQQIRTGSVETQPEVAPTIKTKTSNKLLDFVEQPLFLWSTGLLGGLVGLFIVPPVLFVCGACILLAFHRAGVVRAKRLRVQIFSYGLVVCITVVALLETRQLIKTNLPHIPSAEEVASALLAKAPWLGRPSVVPVALQPSAGQLEEIKQIDDLIVARDENGLRQAFGFPSMLDVNTRMTRDRIIQFRNTNQENFNVGPYQFDGGQMLINNEEGEIRRHGGGFVINLHHDRVSLIMLAGEYVRGKGFLLKCENSSELPISIIEAIKDLDSAVTQNAETLRTVLNDGLKENPDYFLQYDQVSSPYFQHVSELYLNKFIQLRPKADKIRDAEREFVGAKS